MRVKAFLPTFIIIFVIGLLILTAGIVFKLSIPQLFSGVVAFALIAINISANIVIIHGGIITGFGAIGLIVLIIVTICVKSKEKKALKANN
ncbi:MAG: hypothetical protein ACI4MS_04810 [Candidatus Coproplasma sp.]